MTQSETQQELLIVSFSYAPMLNARAFRWTALAEQWASRGVRVSVVCSWLPNQAAHETRNGVEVYRTGFGPMERLRALLARRREEAARQAAGGANAKEHRTALNAIGRLASRHIEQVWRKVYWPDTSCLWYLPALNVAKRLLGKSSRVPVVTVAPTFTAVAVGYALLGRGSRAGRWVIDLGDPFCFADRAPPNNFVIYRSLNYRFERRTFARADAIAVTNPATQREYQRLFPESAAKIWVIPPLLSEEGVLTRSNMAPGQVAESTLRIVFLGTLYRSIRRPDFLLALFGTLQARKPRPPVELHFFGDTHQCSDSFEHYGQYIGVSLFLHGTVSRRQAAQAIRDATILVNIGNDTAYQLPSKLVEYAASGKPIMSISTVANDSSAEFLNTYPSKLCLVDRGVAPSTDEAEAFARFVLQKQEMADGNTVRTWLAPYRMENVASQYERLLFPESGERS